ncbi:hypothetical protein TNCV_2731181 [Trichonephila clavipes]|nr:hypothetical protein TNCV_2731181 [Trichonephila clavipes]
MRQKTKDLNVDPLSSDSVRNVQITLIDTGFRSRRLSRATLLMNVTKICALPVLSQTVVVLLMTEKRSNKSRFKLYRVNGHMSNFPDTRIIKNILDALQGSSLGDPYHLIALWAALQTHDVNCVQDI